MVPALTSVKNGEHIISCIVFKRNYVNCVSAGRIYTNMRDSRSVNLKRSPPCLQSVISIPQQRASYRLY